MAFLAFSGAILAWAAHQTFAGDWNASTTMLVENPENSALFDREVAASPERYTADQVALLESTPVASRALEIVRSSGSTSTELDDITNGVEVESGGDSGLITVTASHPQPETATLIANSVVSGYEEIKEAEAARAFDSAIEEFDSSIQAVDDELAEITEQIAELRAPGGEGETDVDAQAQAAIEQLLELLAEDAADNAELQPILDQLQTLQLIQALRGDDPALASLIESRNQALERRSQLALRRDQLRVDAALTSTGIAVISPARDAGQAVTLPRALLVGILLGAAIGVVVAYAFASRSRRFQHRSEPELLLHAPLLAEVPHYPDHQTSLAVRDSPDSAAAEAYRLAEAGLHRLAGQTELPQVAAIVSAGVGEGSPVTANLAVAAVERGRRVLVIDCNFGDPSMARLLGAPGPPEGITDVVDGGAPLREAVASVDVGPGWEIDLLGKGQRTVTAPTFFHSTDTEKFFSRLPEHYDLVLVDVPSPLQAAYAGSVIRLCERSVIVVPHESEVSVLVDAMNRLALSGGKADGYLYTWTQQPPRLFFPDAPSDERQGIRRWVTPTSQT